MTAVAGVAIAGLAIVGTSSTGEVPTPPATSPAGVAGTGALAVWAVDPDGVRRGMLPVHAAAVVVRDADASTWTMTVNGRDELAKRLGPGWGVLFGDATVTESGPIESLEWSTDGAALDLTLTGVGELSRLADRIIYPNPRLPIDRQDRSHYVASGPSESLIRELAWRNAGTAALVARRSPRLVTVASQGRGKTVKVSERFSNLLEACRAIARAGGTTFSAVDENGTVLLRQRIPRDLSRQVRFTDLNGGATAGTLGLKGATVTAAIVAGQGEGQDRMISEVLAEVTPWRRRIEVLKDRRDTGDTGVVDQAGIDAISEGAETATASFEAVEVPGLVLGRDYLVGDIVSAQSAPGVTVAEPVRSAEITWDGHGRTVKLTLGDAPDENEPAWVARVRDLSARIDRQEAA